MFGKQFHIMIPSQNYKIKIIQQRMLFQCLERISEVSRIFKEMDDFNLKKIRFDFETSWLSSYGARSIGCEC